MDENEEKLTVPEAENQEDKEPGNQEQIETSIAAEPNTEVSTEVSTEEAEPAKPKKKLPKKLLLALLVVLLAVGAAIFAYQKFIETDETANNQPSGSQQQTEQPSSPKHYIAYKVDKTVTIYELSEDTEPAEILRYDEAYAVNNDGNYYTGLPASAALSPDGEKIAYVQDNQLKVLDIATKNSTVIISSKKTNSSSQSELEANALALTPSIEPQGGPGGIFSLSGPEWSQDQKYISFRLGQYEGGSAAAINLESKKYTLPENSFRYVNLDPVNDRFTVVKQDDLTEAGILPSYLIKEYNVVADVLYENAGSLLAILCALDEPDSGHSNYLAGHGDKYQRDCGEPSGNSLISIKLADGTFTPLINTGVQNSIVKIDTAVYTTTKDTNGLAVSSISQAGDTAKIEGPEELKSKKLENIRISNQAGQIIGTAYYAEAAKHYAAVYDVFSKKLLYTQELSEFGRFSAL